MNLQKAEKTADRIAKICTWIVMLFIGTVLTYGSIKLASACDDRVAKEETKKPVPTEESVPEECMGPNCDYA